MAGGTAVGAWSPLGEPQYRRVWSAQLLANTGMWMQFTAAQWLVVDRPRAETLTSWVLAGTTLPVLVASLPAGALVDVVDRRRYLLAVQAGAACVAVAFVVVGTTPSAPDWAVLCLALGMGLTTAMANPAWQAAQPDLVPLRLVAEAAVLGSLNTNVARAIGPALAGALIALLDAEAAFVANLLAVLAVLALLAGWRTGPRERAERTGLGRSLGTLVSYLRSAREPRRLLGRVAVFVAFGSAPWALLAVLTRHRLGLGSSGYGTSLGILGAGAVLGAPLVAALRTRLGATAMVTWFGTAFSLATAALAVTENPVVALALLLPAGAAWLCVLSTLLTAMQLVLPGGIRGRGLAAFLMVFLGGQGVGAVVWGPVADAIGAAPTLLVAAAGGVATCVALARWRLPDRPVAAPEA